MRIAALAVVGLALTLPAAPPQAQQVSAPNHLLAAADGPLWDFALLAVHARVPVGLELHESDDPQPYRPTARPPAPDLVEEHVSLDTVLTAFNRAHREYRAEWADGVIVIRPRAGRAAFLDRQSGFGSVVNVTGVSSALLAIFSPLYPEPPVVLVGSGIGRGALENLTAQLTIDGSPGHTVMSTLNQVARQRQGGWYVLTRTRDGGWDVVRFGSLTSDFGRSRMTVRPPGARAPVP